MCGPTRPGGAAAIVSDRVAITFERAMIVIDRAAIMIVAYILS
jgi:hypothetical protein